jgi:hypothetical protein
MDPRNTDPVAELTGPISLPIDRKAISFCVHHSGRYFRITFDQASAFVRRVDRIMEAGASELVPLLHQGGVELLLVSAQTPLQVHDIRDHSFDRSHR